MRDEALAAIAGAADLDELKQVRLDHAGDRSPIALANREIGALPPQARKEAGARVGQARGAINQALGAAQRRTRGRARGAHAGRGERRRHAPDRPPPARRPTPDHDLLRAARRHLPGHGLGRRRGPVGRGRVAQLRRPQHGRRPPRPHDAGHLLAGAGRGRAGAPHAHLAGPGAHDADASSRRSTSSAPVASSAPTRSTRRTRRSSTRSRAWSSTRASRWPTSRARSTT